MRLSYVDGNIEGSVQIFGAGKVGKEVAYLLAMDGVDIYRVLDNNATTTKQIWEFIECILPEKGDRELSVVIAVANKEAVLAIRKQLDEFGYVNVSAVDCDNLYRRIDELADSDFLKLKYYCIHGKILDLESPKDLNEKLQWLKIHDRNPLYVTLGDKYKAREYLRNLFGEEYLIPLLYVTYDYNDIAEGKIPNTDCAIKSNCWSGDVEIIREGAEVEYDRLRMKFEKIFNSNWSALAREWWYSRMTPCILVEKLLTTKEGKLANDYKLHFLNGKLQFIYCSIDREGANYRKIYSEKWEEVPFSWNGSATPPEFDKPNIKPPATLDKMISMGRIIAEKLPYVRVDYYDVDGKLYFGEITLSHGAGFDRFVPDKYDEIYGERLVLPVKKGENIDNYLERFIPYKSPSHDIWSREEKEDYLKLDWNESTIPPSEYVRNCVIKAANNMCSYNLYPNTNNQILLGKIADYVGVSPENIQVFPSSDVAHEDVSKVWLRKGDACGLVWPAYDNFRATAELSDATVIYCILPDYKYSDEYVEDFVKENSPKMMYICNPNNPTGELISEKSICHLLDNNKDVLFVIDEAYIEFSDGAIDHLVNEYGNLVITRTFSKAFGLANFRIGYVVSSVDNIRLLSDVRNSKNISTLAQEAAIAALEDIEYMKKYVRDVEKGRCLLQRELQSISYVKNVYPSEGNFLTFSIENNCIKRELIKKLQQENIYIRDLGQTPYMREHCARITVGTEEQMVYLVKRLREIIL